MHERDVTSSKMKDLRNWSVDKQAKPKDAVRLTVRLSILTRNTQNTKMAADFDKKRTKLKHGSAAIKGTTKVRSHIENCKTWANVNVNLTDEPILTTNTKFSQKLCSPPTCVNPSREQRFVMISVISVESIVPEKKDSDQHQVYQ